MADAHNSVKEKVAAIFQKMAGRRARTLDDTPHGRTRDACAVENLVAEALSDSYPRKKSAEIAFHLVDWNSNAAFLVALLLFPKRFTYEEIRAGVIQLLVHAPHHVVAAARLGGHPIEDIFVKRKAPRRSRNVSKKSRRSQRLR
jgi:hypothetical protein